MAGQEVPWYISNLDSGQGRSDEYAKQRPTVDTVRQWKTEAAKKAELQRLNDLAELPTPRKLAARWDADKKLVPHEITWDSPNPVHNENIATYYTKNKNQNAQVYTTIDKTVTLDRGDIIQSNETECQYIIFNIQMGNPQILKVSGLLPNGTRLNPGFLGLFTKCADYQDIPTSPIGDGKFILPSGYTLVSKADGSPVVGGKSRAKPVAASKPKGPQPSAERVTVKGRNRIVYVGPKGGRYIKSKGEFVRL